MMQRQEIALELNELAMAGKTNTSEFKNLQAQDLALEQKQTELEQKISDLQKN
jgi:hypothetical protein